MPYPSGTTPGGTHFVTANPATVATLHAGSPERIAVVATRAGSTVTHTVLFEVKYPPATISGQATFEGGLTGHVHVSAGELGETTLDGPGNFTITIENGLPAGTVVHLQAWMDLNGSGLYAASDDPSGAIDVTVGQDFAVPEVTIVMIMPVELGSIGGGSVSTTPGPGCGNPPMAPASAGTSSGDIPPSPSSVWPTGPTIKDKSNILAFRRVDAAPPLTPDPALASRQATYLQQVAARHQQWSDESSDRRDSDQAALKAAILGN